MNIQKIKWLLNDLYAALYETEVTPDAARVFARHGITSREQDVLRLTILGYSSRAAAKTLNLSYRTVEGHRQIIREKLYINESQELAQWAIDNGLLKILF